MFSLGNLEGRFNVKFGEVLCGLLHLRPGTLGVGLMWRHTSKWGQPVRQGKTSRTVPVMWGEGRGQRQRQRGAAEELAENTIK